MMASAGMHGFNSRDFAFSPIRSGRGGSIIGDSMLLGKDAENP